MHALQFSKWDFVAGHLDYLARAHHKGTVCYVEHLSRCRTQRRLTESDLIDIKGRQITIGFIDTLLKANPVILYTDAFAYHKFHHYPHFIVVLRKQDAAYSIFDPWDGKSKLLSRQMLEESISLLRDHLLFSPLLICLRP